MKPDTNQVEMRPQNRARRRAEGWTESRLRKVAVKHGFLHPVPAMQHKGSISCLSAVDPETAILLEKNRRRDRETGKPRRWQVERARRKGLAHG